MHTLCTKSTAHPVRKKHCAFSAQKALRKKLSASCAQKVIHIPCALRVMLVCMCNTCCSPALCARLCIVRVRYGKNAENLCTTSNFLVCNTTKLHNTCAGALIQDCFTQLDHNTNISHFSLKFKNMQNC